MGYGALVWGAWAATSKKHCLPCVCCCLPVPAAQGLRQQHTAPVRRPPGASPHAFLVPPTHTSLGGIISLVHSPILLGRKATDACPLALVDCTRSQQLPRKRLLGAFRVWLHLAFGFTCSALHSLFAPQCLACFMMKVGAKLHMVCSAKYVQFCH